MPIGAAYYRVSTEQQDLERQKMLVHLAATRMGVEIVAEFEDKQGGSLPDRENFLKLQEWVKANPNSYVIASELDRFSRGVGPWSDLSDVCRKYNVILVPLNLPDTGDIDTNDLFRNIMAAFAGFDRRNIVKKMFSGRLTKLKNNVQIVGHKVPFGYNYAPENEKEKIVVNEEEKEIVNQVFDLFANQYYSFYRICDYLNERKITTKTGLNHWNCISIKYMLTNRTYIGEWIWNKYHHKSKFNAVKTENPEDQWVVIKTTPIVPKDLFDKTQELLKSPRYQKRARKYDYLLNRVVYCGKCGKRYNAYKAGNGYKYYRCSSRRNDAGYEYCRNRVQNADRLDNYIWKWLFNLVITREGGKNFDNVMELEKKREKSIESYEEDLKRVDVNTSKLEQRYLQADEMLSKGIIGEKRYISLNGKLDDQKKALEAKRSEIEGKITELRGMSRLKPTVEDFILSQINWRMLGGKDDMSLEKKQEIINAFIEKITIMPEKEVVQVEFKLPFTSIDPLHGLHKDEKVSFVNLVPKQNGL